MKSLICYNEIPHDILCHVNIYDGYQFRRLAEVSASIYQQSCNSLSLDFSPIVT
jgi:hypothetical protein